MVRREDAEREFVRLVPEFKDAWDEYRRGWGEETPGICTDFAEFSTFIHDAMRRHLSLDLPGVFTFIEQCLQDGDEAIKDAAATCFLENLQNQGSHSDQWVHLLGPESRAFCRAWDEFTGVDTPGLGRSSTG